MENELEDIVETQKIGLTLKEKIGLAGCYLFALPVIPYI